MRAQFGISTLIIFIAVVITAAIAAGVIIYTANQLQQKALVSGSQAQERVTTGVEVIQTLLYQYDYATRTLNSNLQAISGIGILLRLGAGSSPINLADLNILLTTDDGRSYSYSAKSIYPSALLATETGNYYLIRGFVYNNTYDVYNVTIYDNQSCLLLKNGTFNYITVGYIYQNVNNTTQLVGCYVALDPSILNTPVGLNTLFSIFQDMHNAGINIPYAIIQTTQSAATNLPPIYLVQGSNFRILLYLPSYIYPNQAFTLIMLPGGGYQVTIAKTVPTVLQYSVQVLQ